MKVKLLCSRVGDGFSQNYGDVVDMPDDEGRRQIDAGLAETVGKSTPAEKKPAAAAAKPVKKKPAAAAKPVKKKPAAAAKK